MGVELAETLKPHHLARQEVDGWRGRCLDFYARGEQVIGRTLKALQAAPSPLAPVKLRHLAGQRADDLATHLSNCTLTAKQAKGLTDALAGWRLLEDQRAFLAHGVLAVALDARGSWFAVFDMIVYKANEPISRRWVVNQAEAQEFRNGLESRLQLLGAQLGQLRKKMVDG